MASNIPLVPPLASIDVHVAWESPPGVCCARGIGGSGFSHATWTSMAQREALGHERYIRSHGTLIIEVFIRVRRQCSSVFHFATRDQRVAFLYSEGSGRRYQGR